MNPLFAANSRYAACAVTQTVDAHGRRVDYLQRRFLPDPSQFAVLQTHRVQQGERIEQIAAHYLGDALASWRVMDANGLQRVEQAQTLGATLRITLAQGVPALSGAQ